MRNYIIAANWKMNLNKNEAINLAKEIESNSNLFSQNVKVIVCTPYIHISDLVDYFNFSSIQVGAQNCNENEKGAFTGEISASMIKSYGCEYVILGHSERREIYNENNELINNKIRIALKNDLKVILCIGESLEQRKEGKTNAILNQQLKSCLSNLNSSNFENIIIAYEPIWAIGTGITPTLEEINETHNVIRHYLTEICGNAGIKMLILYGGSLNEKNASDILKIKEVGGGLIGGASLKCESFTEIIKIAGDYSNLS